jgi:hypothetical protein
MLRGYELSANEPGDWDRTQRLMVERAKYYLTHFRRKYTWQGVLDAYCQIPGMYRAFNLLEGDPMHLQRQVTSIAPEREDTYRSILLTPVPHRKRSAERGEASKYYFFDQANVKREADFADFPTDTPRPHDLEGHKARAPIVVDWEALRETADWMDHRSQAPGMWKHRFNGIRAETFSDNDTLEEVRVLTVEKVSNWVGMVSSGKSTLMTILAVWCARNDLHITLVVGDVITALNLAKTFAELGVDATPMLGRSNRDRHANRLRRLLAADRPDQPQIDAHHIGFRWLSEFCFVDAMLDQDVSLSREKLPCHRMYAPDDARTTPTAHICPAYGICPRHTAQTELVSSRVWIATPASLVYTRVDEAVNPEAITFAELVYRVSDLVVV